MKQYLMTYVQIGEKYYHIFTSFPLFFPDWLGMLSNFGPCLTLINDYPYILFFFFSPSGIFALFCNCAVNHFPVLFKWSLWSAPEPWSSLVNPWLSFWLLGIHLGALLLRIKLHGILLESLHLWESHGIALKSKHHLVLNQNLSFSMQHPTLSSLPPTCLYLSSFLLSLSLFCFSAAFFWSLHHSMI